MKTEITANELLTMIEHIVGDDFLEDLEARCAFHPEKMTQAEIQAQLKLSQIYRIVHSLNRSRSCYSAHKSWRKEVKRLLDNVRITSTKKG